MRIKPKFYKTVEMSRNKIYHAYVGVDGKHYESLERFNPLAYIECDENEAEKSGIRGEHLKSLEFESTHAFYNTNEDSDAAYHGKSSPVLQFINHHYPDEIEYDIDEIHVLNFDIETKINGRDIDVLGTPNEITTIAIEHKDIYCVIGYKDDIKSELQRLREAGKLESGLDYTYIHCQDEKEMLKLFIKIYLKIKPTILIFWYGLVFDVPYLVNRIIKLLGKDYAAQLSPVGYIRHTEKDGKPFVQIRGVNYIDGMDAFQAFYRGTPDSLSLDHISSMMLGTKKLDYYEYGNLDGLYEENYIKYVDYNVKDVYLVKQIFKKMNLLELIMNDVYMCRVPIGSIFGQVLPWEGIINNYLSKQNIELPARTNESRNGQYRGAVVFPPVVGLHRWVMSFDFNSLYPMLMIMLGISPENKNHDLQFDVDVDDLTHMKFDNSQIPDGFAMAANGVLFRNDNDGFIPSILIEMYAKRRMYKNKMIECQKQYEATKDDKYTKQATAYNILQATLKTRLVSAYGMIGSGGSRFADVDLAEAITLTGQLAIQWAKRYANEYLSSRYGEKDYIIAGDTDSVYINYADVVKHHNPADPVQFLDDYARERIEPLFEQAFIDLQHYLKCSKQKLVMKREVISDAAIWRAKKNYAMSVIDNEGVRYEKPKLKVMGLQSIKSNTPPMCREAMNEIIRLLLHSDEANIHKYIKEFKQRYDKADIDEISFPLGIKHINKWIENGQCITGTPYHVRASWEFNNYIEKHNLMGTFRSIGEYEKIKLINLKSNTPLSYKYVAYKTALPKDLINPRIIDYDTMFYKGFLKPVQTILDIVNYEAEPPKNHNLLDELGF